MRKTLILGILLVFALSVQVSSRSHPVISTSGTETISAAQTQQEKPVIPNKQTSKAKTVVKLPDWIRAIDEIVDAAKQTQIQEDRFWHAYDKLKKDPQWLGDSNAQHSIDGIRGFVPQSGSFRLAAEDLSKYLRHKFAQLNAK